MLGGKTDRIGLLFSEADFMSPILVSPPYLEKH